MVKILLDDLSSDELYNIYNNVYNLIDGESNLDNSINNVHSININQTPNNWLNISFDYYTKFRVVVYIKPNGDIQIIAPDSIKDRISSLILNEYPDYNII